MALTIVEDTRVITGGVDTHAGTHVAAALDPIGGLLGVEDAIALALADRSNHRPKPVNALTDPHQLADSDPAWAGGDALRIRRLARAITPPVARPTLRLVNSVPGPLAGALRTGLDILSALNAKVRPA